MGFKPRHHGESIPTQIVKVGKSDARIQEVSSTKVVFFDESGELHEAALLECRANFFDRSFKGRRLFCWDPKQDRWGKREAQTSDSRYVGYRSIGSYGPNPSRPPWVTLSSSPEIRFEFENAESAYRLLLNPLASAGWPTFDRD